jgi:hypothetical protein
VCRRLPTNISAIYCLHSYPDAATVPCNKPASQNSCRPKFRRNSVLSLQLFDCIVETAIHPCALLCDCCPRFSAEVLAVTNRQLKFSSDLPFLVSCCRCCPPCPACRPAGKQDRSRDPSKTRTGHRVTTTPCPSASSPLERFQ